MLTILGVSGTDGSVVEFSPATREARFDSRSVHLFPHSKYQFSSSVYKDISEAVKKHPEVDILVNFASLRSAYDATIEALNLNHVRQ